MRIACDWFLADLVGGGAEQIPLRLASEMRTTDLTVVLLKNRVEHAIPPEGPRVITLSAGAPSLWRGFPMMLGRASSFARRADVLVAGLEWAPTYFTVLCGLASRKPVVATVHVDLARYHELEPVPAAWWVGMRLALRRCAAIVAVSDGVRQSLLPLGADPSRIHVIPNPGPSRSVIRTAPQGSSRLITVASLHPRKGLDVAIAAATRLRDIHFDWVIVGDGPQRDELNRLARQAGVAERIKLVGFKPDPTPFYADADLYVLPSRTEGTPLALIEALNAGLPVVATRCAAGVTELVPPDVGDLVPPDDAEALAGAIRMMIANPSRRESCGRRAREQAAQYHPSIIADRYERLLASVVADVPK